MNRYVKTALLAGAAWSALSTFAMAQDAASQEPSALDDVIVTARSTEESAQRTPLALSAFSGEQLERQGAQQVTDLQGAVPNLNIVQGRGSSNSTNIYIRGVGQPDALQTFDPAVGVYVDDVYYSRIRGTQFDLLDLERVEVLRGPQGTLYGKNTIGGALKLISRRLRRLRHDRRAGRGFRPDHGSAGLRSVGPALRARRLCHGPGHGRRVQRQEQQRRPRLAGVGSGVQHPGRPERGLFEG